MTLGMAARTAIIGAGPSGLAAAKNCLQAGLNDIVVFEKSDQVGGNWVYDESNTHSSVYETTHIISSKALSQFDDYPMPDDYPDYPSHRQLYDYFNGYADQFGIRPRIRFRTEVMKAVERPDKTWEITLKGGKVETFDALFIANGHHWDPRWPEYPGHFTGKFIHSHDYKRAEPFRNQRTLVIGGGNSGADIAVETSRISAHTAISLRRGYYFAPKFVMGKPADVLNRSFLWAPKWLRLLSLKLILWLAVGDYQDYGLQKPDHELLKVHATVNSELLYLIRHGKIHPRPDIARFDGKRVHFVDGRNEEYDTVIAATGFKISFPFFDKAFIDWSDGQDVPLHLLTFHPDHPTLFFVGLVQPLGCIWSLADLQAKLAANTITERYQPPKDIRQRIEKEIAARHKQYLRAPRHTLEVDYHEHRQALLKEARRAGL